MSVVLLLAAVAATAVGAAALHAAHGLRKQLTALRAEVTASARAGAAAVPAPRTTPAAEIRAAVAEALAEERERELAEARAFWAAQETRDAGDVLPPPGGLPGLGDEPSLYLPRQADFAGLEPLVGPDLADMADMPEIAEVMESIEAVDAAIDSHEQASVQGQIQGQTQGQAQGPVQGQGHPGQPGPGAAEAGESPELAAARRRHPSHPDFSPSPAPAVGDHERTVSRLEELAACAVPLADVRPGPLGTLDVYVFVDGTTVCMTPGHRETAERLAGALRAGVAPVLLGGSGISGAYALTFACGEESVYVLADRVIASL